MHLDGSAQDCEVVAGCGAELRVPLAVMRFRGPLAERPAVHAQAAGQVCDPASGRDESLLVAGGFFGTALFE